MYIYVGKLDGLYCRLSIHLYVVEMKLVLAWSARMKATHLILYQVNILAVLALCTDVVTESVQ